MPKAAISRYEELNIHALMLLTKRQAMEKPAELLADVEEYIKKAWKGADKIVPAR